MPPERESEPAREPAERDGHPVTLDEELLAGPDVTLSGLTGEDPARLARMEAELAMGFRALAGVERAVSIFGSARTPVDSPDYDLARRTAAALGAQGFAIISGGGPGSMEAVNRGARDADALSIGLSIELPHEQVINAYVDLAIEFKHFFIRKVMFVRYASAFVVLPGGLGTLDELFEALSLIETGKIQQFPVVMVGVEFWSGLVEWLRGELIDTGKISTLDLEMLHVVDEPDEVVAVIEAACGRQP